MRTDGWDDMFNHISALLAMLIEGDALIIKQTDLDKTQKLDMSINIKPKTSVFFKGYYRG